MKKLVPFLLALLGFSSVYSQEDGENRPLLKYGVPRATFELKGHVTNERNRPVKDAQITITNHDNGTADMLLTDHKGRFEYSTDIFPAEHTYKIQVNDIDGRKHRGDFASQERNVKISQEDYKGTDDPWDKGTVRKEEKFVLRKKNKK